MHSGEAEEPVSDTVEGAVEAEGGEGEWISRLNGTLTE
jgi:hypothetical protein